MVGCSVETKGHSLRGFGGSRYRDRDSRFPRSGIAVRRFRRDRPPGVLAMTITIRRASPNDAAAYAHLMSDPAVFGGLMQMPYPDEELWRTRLADTCAPGNIDAFAMARLHPDPPQIGAAAATA